MQHDAETSPTVEPATRLLGLAAAALLTHFESLAADGHHGESVTDTLELARHASARFAALDRALAVLTDLGLGADEALGGFTTAMGQFHRHSQPSSWPEVLLKNVLVCGFAKDFDALVAERLPPATRPQLGSLVDEGSALAWWAQQSLEARLAAEPELVHRLGLFGRRVLAEASAQAQRLASQHGEVAALVTGSTPGSLEELSSTVQLIADLVEAGAQRMMALGLQP